MSTAVARVVVLDDQKRKLAWAAVVCNSQLAVVVQ